MQSIIHDAYHFQGTGNLLKEGFKQLEDCTWHPGNLGDGTNQRKNNRLHFRQDCGKSDRTRSADHAIKGCEGHRYGACVIFITRNITVPPHLCINNRTCRPCT